MILENFKSGYEVSNGSLIAKGEKNDCVVRACANAFNITYDIAHKFVATEFKRKARKGTKAVYSTFNALGKVAFDLFVIFVFYLVQTDNQSNRSIYLNCSRFYLNRHWGRFFETISYN